jgi:hypothetical protein
LFSKGFDPARLINTANLNPEFNQKDIISTNDELIPSFCLILIRTHKHKLELNKISVAAKIITIISPYLAHTDTNA